MDIKAFNYHLPKSLIANSPSTPRDSSRLLLLNRVTGQIRHTHFRNLCQILTKNDVLVLNQTKVIPASLNGAKDTGGRISVLLLKKQTANTWQILTKHNLQNGQLVHFPSLDNHLLSAKVIKNTSGPTSLKFNVNGKELKSKIENLGLPPLPPYLKITNARDFINSYQTIFAKNPGSIAAPTAGLHFTPRLIKNLESKGVAIEFVNLHIGLGTFKPVSVDNIEDHEMHSENFSLSTKTARRLNQAKSQGKKIIAVGTTSCRVLETCASGSQIHPGSGSTSLFVFPPFKFNFVDSLITNFHLPRSTLLMLVSAFVSHPNTKHSFSKTFINSSIGAAYAKAINRKYRFYSFGDAMFIY